MDPECNALFFDPEHALRCARQRKPVTAWGRATATQLCYYTGRVPLPDSVCAGLDNLIFIPKADFAAHLSRTRLRLPEEVAFPDPPPPAAVQRGFTTFFKNEMALVTSNRESRYRAGLAKLSQLPPDPPCGRLRISAHTCRFTEVIRYSAAGLVDAWRGLGHDARLVMEEDDREFWSWEHHRDEIIAFRPHLAMFFNHHHPGFLAPWMVQAVWWQDPMDALTREGSLPWRSNDLVYCLIGPWFRPLLAARGLPDDRNRVQHFCIDTRLYRPDPSVTRRPRSVTFVGSSYGSELSRLGRPAHELSDALLALLEGGPITLASALDHGRRCGIEREVEVVNVWVSLVRDRMVRHLCSLGPAAGWTVEVYGHGWDADPVVAPFHRGLVTPGADLAGLYRRTERALCLHPMLVNHQRLAEVACCGCIPVIYDCRAASDPPYWEDQCSYFHDEHSLLSALEQPIRLDPQRYMDHFSYRHFAQRILDDAAPHLARIGT